MLKIKLILAGLLFLSGLGIGIKITSNHYKAKHATALEKIVRDMNADADRRVKLAKSQIKERTIIKYKTKVIKEKVKHVQVKSCPKLPSGFVSLYNDSINR